MKRIFLVLTIMFASVLTTACINNFAVQELNAKAKSYLDAGETDKAICRYKSSLDLDGSIFETNYNLGVAYIANKNFEEAISVLQAAIKLNPDVADSYYSLAVAQENAGFDKINGVDRKSADCKNAPESSDLTVSKEDKKEKLTPEEKKEISELFMSAVDNYNHYLALSPNASDKDKVGAQIEDLNKELIKYTPTLHSETED